MKIDMKMVKNVLLKPENFQELKSLSDNIVAYGEMEYLLGYLSGMFGNFKELCEEVNDLKTALEFRERMERYVKEASAKELSASMKHYLDISFMALVHNINKKNNRYGIGG